MFIIRDIFQLKFGMFKDAMAALKKVSKNTVFPIEQFTVLSDFTGDAYRLVMEAKYASLAEYELSLTQGIQDPKWQEFYMEFKTYVISSHREIMRKHEI